MMTTWVYIGILAGSLITSQHETKEACEGRAFTMREAKVERGKCVELIDDRLTRGISILNGTGVVGAQR